MAPHPGCEGVCRHVPETRVARACQYNVIRLAADLERLGEAWLAAHSAVPWRVIKGMRNRIAHNYWTVDNDMVWAVVDQHAQELHRSLGDEINAARAVLDPGGRRPDTALGE